MSKESTGSAKRLPAREFLLLAALLAALALTAGAERIFSAIAEANWDRIKVGQEDLARTAFNEKFSVFQQELFNTADRIATSPELRELLAARHDSSLIPFFDLLQQRSSPAIALELYDPSLRLLGWSGRSSTMPDSAAFTNHPVSRLVEDPLYSTFTVIRPVTDSGIAGYVVAKRLFDAHYPINNRFVNPRVFDAAFSRTIDPERSYRFFSRPESVHKIEGKLYVDIVGVDGSVVGLAETDAPTLAQRLAGIRSVFGNILNVVLLLTAGMLAWLVFRLPRGEIGPTLEVVRATAVIWFIRYVLLWTGLPGAIASMGIFEPGLFTSTLAGGLARSPGDLFLSCCALVLNVVIVGSVIARQEEGGSTNAGVQWLEVVFCPIFVLLFFAFLRGFLAAVRSAVLDSSLSYHDPMFVIPPFTMAIMLISLLMIAAALVRGSFLVVAFLYRTLRTVPSLRSRLSRWIGVLVLLAGGAVSFSAFAADPLSDAYERLFFTALVMAGAFIAYGPDVIISHPFNLKTLAVVFPLAAGLVVTQLDNNVHRADRLAVEQTAREMVRPADAYFTSIVTRSLGELAEALPANSAGAMLNSQSASDLKQLAFLGWARSVLSREGYNCWVGYLDSTGAIVSDFHLGLFRHRSMEHGLNILDRAGYVRAEERVLGGEPGRTYRGFSPMYGPDSILAGGIVVELSADRHVLLGGGAPEFLRNDISGNPHRLFRPVSYSEYFQGKLLSTTSEEFPKDRQTPAAAQRVAPGWGTWIEERINGRDYESFYMLRPEDAENRHDGSIVSLSLLKYDTRWHLFMFIRSILFFVVIISGSGAMVFVARGFRRRRVGGSRWSLSFRTKLLIAFVAVSFIPLGILAYYNRQYAVEREDQVTSARLREQTDAVASSLQSQRGLAAPVDIERITDENCGDLADELGVDFAIYGEAFLQASSKPEVFSAELFDSRLSAAAFTGIVLHKTGFFSERQAIGAYSYVVGYRPVLSESGTVIGVISVPTIYDQAEIEDELTQRNSFLFIAYALALTVAGIAGLFFSRQISSPVLRLREAAAAIGSGNLDITVNRSRNDELGELEATFSRMAADLKAAQEQAFRVQRELAWKEMARQVAHEIKNPLTPMKLSIQHLRQAGEDKSPDFDKTLGTVIDTLLEQIDTLSRIATEFSRFGKMPDRLIEPCVIDDVVAEAVRLFDATEQITLRLSLEASGVSVSADRQELRRAVINLLKNAEQAIPGAGEIAVATSAAGSNVILTIKDTGKGIPDEIKPRLFEPNFSTKTEGTGLGLALVKKTMDDLGGSVSIASVLGTGTTVTLSLPISSQIRI